MHGGSVYREEVFPRMPGVLASAVLAHVLCVPVVLKINRSTCNEEEHDVTEDECGFLRSLVHRSKMATTLGR